ncbi:MAG TPA: Crp/Fnr family transcriptional regulator [Devosiaceae bacterium]|jgi:CRP-like cAMP-binding protein
MSVVQKNFAQPQRLTRISAEIAERAITRELGLKAIERVYEPGGIVLEEGDPVTSIKLVKSGWVGSEIQLLSGARLIIDVYLKNDILQLPTVAGEARASARAIDQVRTLEFPVTTLTALLVHRPDIARYFEAASKRVEAIHVEHIVRLSRFTAIARTAHFLLELGQRIQPEHSGPEMSFACPLTQGDFADALGLTPIHVNRTLRKLRALGLATVEKKIVRLHDWDRLSRLSEFNADYLRDDVILNS